MSKNSYLLVLDYLMMASLTLAGFLMPQWDCGPFVGGFAYMVLRYLYAAATDDHIHERIAYRLLDLFFLASLVLAGFTLPSGNVFAGAFAFVVLRFLYEAIMGPATGTKQSTS